MSNLPVVTGKGERDEGASSIPKCCNVDLPTALSPMRLRCCIQSFPSIVEAPVHVGEQPERVVEVDHRFRPINPVPMRPRAAEVPVETEEKVL